MHTVGGQQRDEQCPNRRVVKTYARHTWRKYEQMLIKTDDHGATYPMPPRSEYLRSWGTTGPEWPGTRGSVGSLLPACGSGSCHIHRRGSALRHAVRRHALIVRPRAVAVARSRCYGAIHAIEVLVMALPPICKLAQRRARERAVRGPALIIHPRAVAFARSRCCVGPQAIVVLVMALPKIGVLAQRRARRRTVKDVARP
jgi:hypothetical protein